MEWEGEEAKGRIRGEEKGRERETCSLRPKSEVLDPPLPRQ